MRDGNSTSDFRFTTGGNNGSIEHSYINGNGNLGIGLINPTQKLHVSGNMRLTGAYYDRLNSPGTAGQILSSTVNGTEWIPAPSGSGSDNDWVDSVSKNIVYNNSDSVGIGTNSPTVKLHVKRRCHK